MTDAAREEQELIARGVSLFNEARFFEAHEVWEEIWRPATGERRQTIQGLIQLASAYVHVQRGTFSGGVRLFDKAFSRLDVEAARLLHVEIADALTLAREHRERIAGGGEIAPREYPRLGYN